jgi:hypothetical protein
LPLEDVLARDATSLRKAVAEAKLVVVHSEGIDKAGEKGVGLLVFDKELRELRAAIAQLREAGVRRFVVTADHGFLLHDAITRAPLTHGFKTDPKRRHVVSFEQLERPGEVAVRAGDLAYECEAEAEAWFLLPESAAPFDIGEKAKDFVHGGNSLQERVIPVLTIQHRRAAGAAEVGHRIVASALSPVARMHCFELTVTTRGQSVLAFGGQGSVEVVVDCPDNNDVDVQLLEARQARIAGNAVIATLDQRCEIFFRLIGPREQRVRLRLRHGSGGAEVLPCVLSERFEVERIAAEPEHPGPEAGVAIEAEMDGWLLELPEGGVRDVFRHLSVHGSVNEAEATRMLGSARAFRRFSRSFEVHARLAPFSVRVEVASGSKCYVLGES